jgi:hypothetical protein
MRFITEMCDRPGIINEQVIAVIHHQHGGLERLAPVFSFFRARLSFFACLKRPGPFSMVIVSNSLRKAFVRYSCQVIFSVCFYSFNGFVQFQIVWFLPAFLIYFLVNSHTAGLPIPGSSFYLLFRSSPCRVDLLRLLRCVMMIRNDIT